MTLQRFQEIAQECHSLAAEIESSPLHKVVQKVSKGVRIVGRASSQSWIGYQAHIYYRNFRTPPPGDHFSSEWGFEQAFGNPTSTNWSEVSFEDVEAAVNAISGNQDLSELETRSASVSKIFRNYQSEIVAMLTVALEASRSESIEELRDKAKGLKPFFPVDDVVASEMPRGQFMTRDRLAVSQGLQPPHHVVISCRIASLGSSFHQIGELGNIAEAASNYLRQKFAQVKTGILADGTVFIGHGRSADWQTLSAFLCDRLKLKWDEFNREPTAGLSIKERLESTLDQANFAFLIMTAEDQHMDDTLHARENVIHEIGLFQGRLGFNRAIILLEEGCNEFSNVHGIGQLRYPKGYITATFEEIRRVLEREGVLPSGG